MSCKLQDFKKMRVNIVKNIRKTHSLDDNWDYRLMNILDKTYIICPWCDASIRFRDNNHVRKHYCKTHI